MLNHRVEPGKATYYPSLDGLRAIAVLLVFAVHAWPTRFSLGWVGVQTFFVLSGFLITGILFDSRHDGHRFRNFYVRRALRIFPLYYGFLLVCLGVLFVTRGHWLPNSWLFWVYLSNFYWLLGPRHVSDVLSTGGGFPFVALGHLWSLAVEEQFYLLWPLVVFFVGDRGRLMQISFGVILFRIALGAYWQLSLAPETLSTGIIYRMLPTQSDALLMGGMLSLWLRGDPRWPSIRKTTATFCAALAAYGVLMIWVRHQPSLQTGKGAFDFTSSFQAVIGIPLVNLISLLAVLAVIQPGTWVHWLGSLRPLRSLGRVSYGFYLLHVPVIVMFRFLIGPGVPHYVTAGAILSFVVTVCLAAMSFRFYERPFLRLKDRFTRSSA